MSQFNNDFLGWPRRQGGDAQIGGLKAGGRGTYVPTITATANPTLGTISANSAEWTRDGAYINISYFLKVGTGTAGTGTYRFSLPPGIKIDSTLYNNRNALASDSSTPACIGTGIGSNTGDWSSSSNVLMAIASYNLTSFTLLRDEGDGIFTAVGSSAFGFDNAMCLAINLRFRVEGWSEYGQE